MGNTQILIDLAWVLQRTSTLEKIYMLKYGRVIVEILYIFKPYSIYLGQAILYVFIVLE